MGLFDFLKKKNNSTVLDSASSHEETPAIRIGKIPYLYDSHYSFLATADIQRFYDDVAKVIQAIVDSGQCYEDPQFSGTAYRNTIWRYQYPLIPGCLKANSQFHLFEVCMCFDNNQQYTIGFLPKDYTKFGLDLIVDDVAIALQICGGEKRYKSEGTYMIENVPYTIKVKYDNGYKELKEAEKKAAEMRETMKVVGTRYYKKEVSELVKKLKKNNQLTDNYDYKEERRDFIELWDGEPVYQYEPIELECILMKEPQNVSDRNAIAVYVPDEDNNLYHIGYIPREKTGHAIELIDSNYLCSVVFRGLKYRSVWEDDYSEPHTEVCDATVPFQIIWRKQEQVDS